MCVYVACVDVYVDVDVDVDAHVYVWCDRAFDEISMAKERERYRHGDRCAIGAE